MKKSFPFFILLALLSVLAFHGCGIFHLKGEVPDYKQQLYTCKDSSCVRSIAVDNDSIPVEIRNSENENIYFHYYLADDGSNQYIIKEDGGVLDISNQCDPNYGVFVFGDQYSSDSYKNVKLELFIPSDYSGSLSVKTLDENIRIYGISIGNLEIETRDGDVFFENTSINDRLYCKTEDGDINGILAGKLSEYHFKAKSSEGERNLNPGDSSNKSVEFTTDDGDIHVSFDEK